MRKLADRMLNKLAPKATAEARCLEAPEYAGCFLFGEKYVEWLTACGKTFPTAVECKP